MSIWEECGGKNQIRAMQAEPWRVVEDQFHLSSRDLVDSRDEHELLEQMLEDSKPAVETWSHYLLFTPFRYPPLKYGSRFGGRFEPSLWYGSLEKETAFAEVAYYRFKFFRESTADLGYIQMNMTAFSAILNTDSGIYLTDLPFDQYRGAISDPQSYSHSQTLGRDMRENKVLAFQYYSARTQEAKINLGVYSPSVFEGIRHHQNWVCISHSHSVEFNRQDLTGTEFHRFSPPN